MRDVLYKNKMLASTETEQVLRAARLPRKERPAKKRKGC